MAADVKLYQREGYDRLVIDSTRATVSAADEKRISLGQADRLVVDEAAVLGRAISALSKKAGSIDITLTDAVTDTRHFKIGTRLIIDMFVDGTVIAAQQAAEVKPQIRDEMPPSPAEKAGSAMALAAAIIADGVAETVFDAVEEVTPAQNALPEVDEVTPQMPVVETISAAAHPTIVTLSSTSPFSVAAFVRLNRLFLVSDQPKAGLPPQITGAGDELGWEIREVAIAEGSKAWVVDIPDAAFVRAEGGRLVWRFIISDQKPEGMTSAGLRRDFSDPSNPAVEILLSEPQKALRVTDPDYGDDLAVFTTAQARHRFADAYDFVDFDILPAAVGAVVKPESDGVRVAIKGNAVRVEKRGGLIIGQESHNDIVAAYQTPEEDAKVEAIDKVSLSNSPVLFFNEWGAQLSDVAFVGKRQQLDKTLSETQKTAKIDILLDLAKLMLSRGMGAEAAGYLAMAGTYNPLIVEAPEYKALKGAAHFLSRQYDLAIPEFSDKGLNKLAEIRLWHTASLAALGQMAAARNLYPDNADMTLAYPLSIRMAVIPPVIAAFIDGGDGEKALDIIGIIDVQNKKTLNVEDIATIAYLKGQAQKIGGYPEKAIESLSEASLTDKLGPYGIRSEMMLVEDALKREVITRDEAIKRLERLRFAWRGDALEQQIYEALGQVYIDNNQPRQGLNILKRAAENAEDIKGRRAIVRRMSEAYNTLFLGDNFENLDPVEAVSVYDEFKELTPVGDTGNALIDRLADKLMDIGLLSRAVTVLQDKMERLEGGEHAIKTGLRIAAIQLIDRQPQATLETLKTVDTMIRRYDGEGGDDLNAKIVLLKARAYSDNDEADKALFIMEGLPDTDDLLRLRVDTAWRAGNWVVVADSLQKLIMRENLTPSVPPTQEQAQMILNAAIALNLSDQYNTLQMLAANYDRVMKQTPVYKTFQLVTRASNAATLSDRQTLLDMTSEVDLFRAFLENTKTP